MKRDWLKRLLPGITSLCVSVLVLAGLTFIPVAAVAQSPSISKIYWTNPQQIRRSDPDGPNIEDLVVGGSFDVGLALDQQNDKMYWTDFSNNRVKRSDLNGQNVEILIDGGITRPRAIALDLAGGKMYIAADSGGIRRANLDGSGLETIVPSVCPCGAIALDLINGKVYWLQFSDRIVRANLDGSDVESLVTTGINFANGIALDVEGGKMYWRNNLTGIERADLDGDKREDVIPRGAVQGPNTPTCSLALDLEAGKIYYTANGTGVAGGMTINQANLDGSDNVPVITGLGTPCGIALEFSPIVAIEAVIEDLDGIAQANPGTPVADKMNDAVAKLETAIEELEKDPPDNQAAVGNIEGAVGEIEAAVDEGLNPAQGNPLMDQLAGVARQLAVGALDIANAEGGKLDEIADAQAALAEGDGLRTEGKFKDAVNKYKDALSKAESAIG